MRAGHDDLAVIPASGQLQPRDHGLQARQFRRPVIAAAGEQIDIAAVDPGQQPVAVEFDLVDPLLRIRRRAVGGCGQLRRQHRGQLRTGRLRREPTCNACTAIPAKARLGGNAMRGSGCQRIRRRRRRRRDAVRQFIDHTELAGRPHVPILLLDEQPRWLLFALALDANQGPLATQFPPAQFELDAAAPKALARVGERSPGAGVPDHHAPRPILPCGNRAFKARVGDRMVLHLHRHAFDRGIEARPFGHGPALHGAVEFKAEVIVQVTGPVFLDHERQCASGACTALRRFRREREIPFGPVAGQRVGAGDHGWRWVLHAVSHRASIRRCRSTLCATGHIESRWQRAASVQSPLR